MTRKLLNDPFSAVDEMLEGVARAHDGRCELLPGGRALVTRERDARRRVALITGRGSGHEPAFFGWLGRGLADGVAVGDRDGVNWLARIDMAQGKLDRARERLERSRATLTKSYGPNHKLAGVAPIER